MDGDETSSREELRHALVHRFDVLNGQPLWSTEADRLIRDCAADLLPLRHDEVVARLASPARGPGPDGTGAAAAVLRVLGSAPAIERAWRRWVDEGRFDGLRAVDPGSTTVVDLRDTLRSLVDEGVLTEDHAIVHAALAHWSELLRHPDPQHRHRGRTVVGALLEARRPFPSALGPMILRALRDDPSSAASALRSAARRLERAGGRGSR